MKFKRVWKQSSLTAQTVRTDKAGEHRSLPAHSSFLWTSTLMHKHCISSSCFLRSLSALLIIHHPLSLWNHKTKLQNRCTPPIPLLSWQRAKRTSEKKEARALQMEPSHDRGAGDRPRPPCVTGQSRGGRRQYQTSSQSKLLLGTCHWFLKQTNRKPWFYLKSNLLVLQGRWFQ